MDYKCTFCGKELRGKSDFDVNTGFMFCVPKRNDFEGGIRNLGDMSHSYQYMMQSRTAVVTNRLPISEIERILARKARTC